jgi:hypothetical protein
VLTQILQKVKIAFLNGITARLMEHEIPRPTQILAVGGKFS